jgi:gluconokinase
MRGKAQVSSMATFPLRSPSEQIGGLFYFGRMLDKIRLHAKGELHSDYHVNLGKGFDEKCVKFLRVNYDDLVERVKKDGTDEEILQWCFSVGHRPSESDIYVWNEFMRKRGWNDEVSEILKRRKREAGMSDRSDIETSFQFIDADEGRLPGHDLQK